MTPLVSILIPAYNAERTIAETLRSVEAQTWPAIETIVVDDGSTDRTVQIARSFTSPKLKVVTRANAGATAARNYAFSLSQGDFIQWLDADDLLGTQKLARQMEAAREYPPERTLFSGEWGTFAYRPERAKFVPTSLWCDLSPAEFLLRKMEGNVYMAGIAWLVSRELSEVEGLWDPASAHDNDGEYFCRIFKHTDQIRFVPGARVFARRTGSVGISYIGASNRKLDSMHHSLRVHIDTLLSFDGSARAKAAGVTLLESYLPQFYPARPDLIKAQQQWAAELGGSLAPPRLRPKYAWLEPLLGYTVAKRAELVLPRLRHQLASAIDKALYQWQGEKALPI